MDDIIRKRAEFVSKISRQTDIYAQIEKTLAVPINMEKIMQSVNAGIELNANIDKMMNAQIGINSYSFDISKYLIPEFSRFEAIEATLRSSIAQLENIHNAYENFGLSFKTFDLENPTENETSEEETIIELESSRPIILLDDVLRVKRIIQNLQKDNQEIFKLKPRDYEHVIAELFRSKNFQVELTKQTRDGGYDLIAIKSLDGFPNKYLIECKHYREDRPVGIQIVRSFMDVIKENNANKGIICTTSYFSKDAIKRQDTTPYILELKDRMDVLSWVDAYGK